MEYTNQVIVTSEDIVDGFYVILNEQQMELFNQLYPDAININYAFDRIEGEESSIIFNITITYEI